MTLKKLLSYVDASGDESQSVLSVSGCLATPGQWAGFDEKWQDYLKLHDFPRDPRSRRYVFHATEFFCSGHKDFSHLSNRQKQIIHRDLLHMIKDHTVYRFAWTVLMDEFRFVEQEFPKLRQVISGRPGTFISGELFRFNGAWAKAEGFDPSVSYVFERGDSFLGQLSSLCETGSKHFDKEYGQNDDVFKNVSSMTVASKDAHSGLNAADLIAWHTARFAKSRTPRFFRGQPLVAALKPNPEMAILQERGKADFLIFSRDAIKKRVLDRIRWIVGQLGHEHVIDMVEAEAAKQGKPVIIDELIRAIVKIRSDAEVLEQERNRQRNLAKKVRKDNPN
jgi:hypothetical protein